MTKSTLLLAVLCLTARAAAAPPVAWTAPSLLRIAENAPPGPGGTITIYAARGESESFQIGVTATTSSLTKVVVTAHDFVSGTNRIDESAIVMYREHYIPHTYADALIPFKSPKDGSPVADATPFGVTAGYTQPVWVDVNVPRTAAAATYTSTFDIASEQGNTSVLVSLVVWDFTLPVQPALQSAFLMERPSDALIKELLVHRLMPKDVPPATELAYMDRGLNITSFPCWANPDDEKGTIDPPWPVEVLTQIAAGHRRDLPLYCYSTDELTNPALYDGIKAWARNLHAAGIDQLATMRPNPKLYCDQPGDCPAGSRRSAIDIWTVLPMMYDAAEQACRDVQRKGDQVWSYNVLHQDDYSPKWEFGSAPIEFRIQPGFINQSLRLTGLLYWRVDVWARWTDPKKPSWYPQRPWDDPAGERGPGDGILVYDAGRIGIPGYVVPSMRLKWLRDGVDDFDYIALLDRAGRSDLALSVARSVGANWHDWTRDPQALEAARLVLGYALSARTAAVRTGT